MTDHAPLQTVATVAVAADGITPPAVDAVDGIDLRRVTRLAMYSREALFVVDLEGRPRLAVEREVYYELLRALESDPGRRLLPVTAGLYDVIWRVEPRAASVTTPQSQPN
jgi:hypothetical protein